MDLDTLSGDLAQQPAVLRIDVVGGPAAPGVGPLHAEQEHGLVTGGLTYETISSLQVHVTGTDL